MTELPFKEDMTLKEAQDLLRTLVDEGHKCPCCTQFAKVYRRPFPSAAARVLIAMYRTPAGQTGEYVDIPALLDRMTGTAHQGGYGTFSHHWDLIAPQPGQREDGSTRVGFWRLTNAGVAFVRGHHTVPKYAHIYNNRRLKFSGKHITIRDALGKKFDYTELMSG